MHFLLTSIGVAKLVMMWPLKPIDKVDYFAQQSIVTYTDGVYRSTAVIIGMY